MGNNSFSDNLKRFLGITSSNVFGYAKCIDNADPLRVGRVRALPQSPNPKDKTLTDENISPWDKEDPHVYLSLLPYQINVIPMKGELITVFVKDGVKDTLDKVYVGPVISHPSKVKMDKSENAMSITAKVNQGILGEPYLLGNPNSDVLFPQSSKKGVFPNPEDIALIGRDNTDIILGMRESSMPDESDETTENWYPQILIRSGKFKQSAESTIPDRYNKPSFIQLNTFNKKYTYEEEEETTTDSNDAPLNLMVVYYVDPTPANLSLTLATNNGYVALYKVNGLNLLGGKYENEDIPGITSGILKEPLVRSNFVGLTIGETRTLINEFISNVDSGDFTSLRKTLTSPDTVKEVPGIIHPLYFRPDTSTLEIMEASRSGAVTQAVFDVMKSDLVSGIQNKVKLSGVKTNGYGLALTSEKREVKVEASTDMVKKLKLQGGKQGFVTIGSDKIYIFSHDATDLGYINLSDTSYGVSQEKLITDIEGKTNSIVRGEELLKLLEKMVDFMEGHVHEYHGHTCCPQAKDNPCTVPEIRAILAEAPIKVLNQNIRIN